MLPRENVDGAVGPDRAWVATHGEEVAGSCKPRLGWEQTHVPATNRSSSVSHGEEHRPKRIRRCEDAVTGRSCAVNCGRGSNISIVREFEP